MGTRLSDPLHRVKTRLGTGPDLWQPRCHLGRSRRLCRTSPLDLQQRFNNRVLAPNSPSPPGAGNPTCQPRQKVPQACHPLAGPTWRPSKSVLMTRPGPYIVPPADMAAERNTIWDLAEGPVSGRSSVVRYRHTSEGLISQGGRRFCRSFQNPNLNNGMRLCSPIPLHPWRFNGGKERRHSFPGRYGCLCLSLCPPIYGAGYKNLDP